MRNLEKLLESSLLETLLEARSDEFETICIRKARIFNDDNEINPESELLEELEKIIADKEKLNIVKGKLKTYEEALAQDYEASIKRLYKLGFIDGYNFKKELKKVIDEDISKRKSIIK